MTWISVEAADKIIQSNIQDFGFEVLPYASTIGRVLAEDLYADRDLPPFNRATVDGIAITFEAYKQGMRSFIINGTQAAGQSPLSIKQNNDCIEIMTGGALDDSVDTIIRYEDVDIADGIATIKNIAINKGQNIHQQGKDKRLGDIVAVKNSRITPALIGLAASIGKTTLQVKNLPKVAIITTGDEMVSADAMPNPYELRQSNGVIMKTVLEKYKINADVFHLKDDSSVLKNRLNDCLKNYDVLLMSGGVSMGKYDYVPAVLEALGVEKLFHKVQQRPGKPFWFGLYKKQKAVFAFPGNPVSAFMCLHRYFTPWLESSLGIINEPQYAVLQTPVCFAPALQYFVQVKLQSHPDGRLLASTFETNGSGDFSHLQEADAFMELPLDKNEFQSGESYKIWKF